MASALCHAPDHCPVRCKRRFGLRIVSTKTIWWSCYPHYRLLTAIHLSFQFQLYDHGKWKLVSIDDRIPCRKDGGPVFSHCKDSNELWFDFSSRYCIMSLFHRVNISAIMRFRVQLFEKAHAKLKGGYQALYAVPVMSRAAQPNIAQTVCSLSPVRFYLVGKLVFLLTPLFLWNSPNKQMEFASRQNHSSFRPTTASV